jgi:hypothetical protein
MQASQPRLGARRRHPPLINHLLAAKAIYRCPSRYGVYSANDRVTLPYNLIVMNVYQNRNFLYGNAQ